MDDKRRLHRLRRIADALDARESALGVQRARESSLVEKLLQDERAILERRSDTIAGLTLELELAGARLTRVVAEREQAALRERIAAEAWARTRRIGDVLERRRAMLTDKLERAEEEQRMLDWVAAVHLRK